MADIIRRGKAIKFPESHVEDFRYWDDPRWAEAKRLRETGDPGDRNKADELEAKIKKHWGVS